MTTQETCKEFNHLLQGKHIPEGMFMHSRCLLHNFRMKMLSYILCSRRYSMTTAEVKPNNIKWDCFYETKVKTCFLVSLYAIVKCFLFMCSIE